MSSKEHIVAVRVWVLVAVSKNGEDTGRRINILGSSKENAIRNATDLFPSYTWRHHD